MAFENRRYVIITASDITEVDFDEVLETSAETCRYSTDGSKTFVKYDGDQPPSIAAIISKSQAYSHDEILDILSGDDWTYRE
jgi:hypothetical protein